MLAAAAGCVGVSAGAAVSGQGRLLVCHQYRPFHRSRHPLTCSRDPNPAFGTTLSSLSSPAPPLHVFCSAPPTQGNGLDATGGVGGGDGRSPPWKGGGGGDSEEEGSGSLGFFSGCIFLLAVVLFSVSTYPSAAAALTGVWELTGRKRVKLAPDPSGRTDSFVPTSDFICVEHDRGGSFVPWFNGGTLDRYWRWCTEMATRLLLPDGYPESVSSDYMDYTLWRGVQGIASQISGVLSTQALLYAVGLGKGVIPTAAALNWVLKDGIGYLSKIALSKFGRHFDVHPKGWRLFADLLENAAHGLEILTPIFPHMFVTLGAVAGASRSAAALIQAATRSCFFAGFAIQRNSAEVIAKGEAQGMVSKFAGIALGIALANYVGSSVPLALLSYFTVTTIHMYCNLKSYQSILLRTLNPYRASLVFSEYLLSGQIPSIKDVNNAEPLFPNLPIIGAHKGRSEILSAEAKTSAGEICSRLQLGSQLSGLVDSPEDVAVLFELFGREGYLLIEKQGRFHVILKEGSSAVDMLKSVFHVNYLYWLEKNVRLEPRSLADECKPGGRIQMSLDYVEREFGHVKHDGLESGWVTDGLIARPLPTRIRSGYGIDKPNRYLKVSLPLPQKNTGNNCVD